MKHYISIILLLLLCNFCYAQTSDDWNPDNPPEPQAQYALTLQAFPTTGGTVSGGGKYAKGTRVSVRASAQTGFRFDGWYDIAGEIVSSSANFYYVMDSKSVALTARFTYDPSNPDEPTQQKLRHVLTLKSEPVNGGSVNVNSGERHQEGSSIYLYAYPSTGFKFSAWKMGEQTLSTNISYTHTMGTENQEIKAVFYYDPSNPNEPGKPTDQEVALITLTTQAPPNTKAVYPVYLLSQNIDIMTLSFDIQFPENVPVDYTSATLATNRIDDHAMVITPLADVTNGYHVDIDGTGYLQGNEGVLVYIPITIPETWANHESHPVTLTNALMDGVTTIPVRNGAITSFIDDGQLNIHANFYTDAFFSRVQFKNLTSDDKANFRWDFGDGTTSTEKDPFHVFASSGDYMVKLAASNEYAKDSIQLKVSVLAEDSWKWSGTVSLNKEMEAPKSFTDAINLFTFMNTGSIVGDLAVQIQNGQTFEIPMTGEVNAVLQSLTGKLIAGNFFLTLKSDIPSIINFLGIPSPDYFKSIMDLGRQLKLSNVNVSIFGIPVDVTAIYGIKEQVICSGESMSTIDLKTISQGLTFKWKAINVAGTISGFVAEGTDVIPEAVLQNTTAEADSIIYQIEVQALGSTLYTCAYKVVVLPGLIGTLDGLFPDNGEEQDQTTIRFSWKNIMNSVYDLYLWEAGTEMPKTPSVTNLTNYSYISRDYCKYGKSYQWKVVARNKCSTLESEVAAFKIRHLPDLHIYNVEADSKVYSGKTLTVTWRVQNDGQGSTLPETWYEQIRLVPDLKAKRLFDEGCLLEEMTNLNSLESGEGYEQTKTVVIPESAEGDYYLLITSGIWDLQTIDFSLTNDSVPEVYTPNINGKPYSYLKALSYNQTLLEETGINLTDNFFFKKIRIAPSPRPDLVVEEIIVPKETIETFDFVVEAMVLNQGDTAIINKKWRDYLYVSKKNKFDASAIRIADYTYEGDLNIGENYKVTFQVTAPIDSLVSSYYYVKTDAFNEIVESNEDNNVGSGASVNILPYMMEDTDYAVLRQFYEMAGGKEWYKVWEIDSRRIFKNKWYGVEFSNGHVKNIVLENNNLKGQLPKELFALPELEGLYLNNNHLIGKLDTLFNDIIPSTSLRFLYIGNNDFEGMLPTSILNFTNLNALTLSGNHIESIESALPIQVELFLYNQTLAKNDSIQLAIVPELDIPSISRYSHWQQSFESYPDYDVSTDGSKVVQHLWYNKDIGYSWDNEDWIFPSDTEFTIIQRDGDAWGTTSGLKVHFNQGDANIDQAVDVLDVQHSLNYIFRESPKPFNFVAANTYNKDSLITVQDIVSTVNIILDSDIISSVQQIKARNKEMLPATNTMNVENGYLVLNTEQPVAAMDVVLKGISGKQLRLLLNNSSFQMLTHDTENGVRFILFSPTGDIIPQGSSRIVELNSTQVSLLEAELSDREAKRVPVMIDGAPTDIENVFLDEITVRLSSDAVIYTLPTGINALKIALYTPQGMMITQDERLNVDGGSYRLPWPSMGIQGVYILRLTVLSEGQQQTKNFKLIISK